MIPLHRSFAVLGCSVFLGLTAPALRAVGFFESFETGLPVAGAAVATGQTLTLASGNWYAANHSTTIGTQPGVFENSDASVFGPYDGNHYAGFNYQATSGNNTISVWLITPTLSFTAGDTVSFYTRTVSSPMFADRLYVRASDEGASLNIGSSATDVGDFDIVLGTVNPTLVANGYPNAYTLFTYTVPFTGSGRIAFNYQVASGGPSGANSDYIGLDAVSISFASAIPEPSTYAALAGLGVLGLAVWRRRR